MGRRWSPAQGQGSQGRLAIRQEVLVAGSDAAEASAKRRVGERFLGESWNGGPQAPGLNGPGFT